MPVTEDMKNVIWRGLDNLDTSYWFCSISDAYLDFPISVLRMSQLAADGIQVLISPQPVAPSLGILLFLSMMAFRKRNPITECTSFVQGTTSIKENETKLVKFLKSPKGGWTAEPCKSTESLCSLTHSFWVWVSSVLDELKDKGTERCFACHNSCLLVFNLQPTRLGHSWKLWNTLSLLLSSLLWPLFGFWVGEHLGLLLAALLSLVSSRTRTDHLQALAACFQPPLFPQWEGEIFQRPLKHCWIKSWGTDTSQIRLVWWKKELSSYLTFMLLYYTVWLQWCSSTALTVMLGPHELFSKCPIFKSCGLKVLTMKNNISFPRSSSNIHHLNALQTAPIKPKVRL